VSGSNRTGEYAGMPVSNSGGLRSGTDDRSVKASDGFAPIYRNDFLDGIWIRFAGALKPLLSPCAGPRAAG